MTNRTPILTAVCALLVLPACVTKPADPRSPAPLRTVETEEDRLYLDCVRLDPFFRTPECRQLRAVLSDDPYPGGSGR